MNDDKTHFTAYHTARLCLSPHPASQVSPTSLTESPPILGDTEPDPQGHQMQYKCITLTYLTHSNFSLSLPLYPQTDFWNFSYAVPPAHSLHTTRNCQEKL